MKRDLRGPFFYGISGIEPQEFPAAPLVVPADVAYFWFADKSAVQWKLQQWKDPALSRAETFSPWQAEET